MTKNSSKEKLVVIGNGMAGGRFLSELLERDADRFEIVVIGAEPHGNYNRILLSPVLSGEKNLDEIMINSLDWYTENLIDLMTNAWVTAVDTENKLITVNHEDQIAYDKLVIATGSNPFILPIPGNELEGVVCFRDINDVHTMMEACKTHKKAVVIGGGLLGLEAANGLMLQGMEVTVVQRSNCLMDRQLDQTAGELLQNSLEERGIHFKMQGETSAFESKTGKPSQVGSVKFADGSSIETDLVVMTAGIRPNITLAQSADLECQAGIVVDDLMRTSKEDVFALGECVQHRGQCYGLVAPLYEMASTLAAYLVGDLTQSYTGTVTSTKLKVTGIDVFSVGEFIGSEKSEAISLYDPQSKTYRKLLIEDNQLVGAVLMGDTSLNAEYMDLIMGGYSIKDLREELMFGPIDIAAIRDGKKIAA